MPSPRPASDLRRQLVHALLSSVTLALLAGCEAVNGGLVEMHWQLASSGQRIISCADAQVSKLRLELSPIGMDGGGGAPASFSFDCTVERAETGFVVQPGDYLAILSAIGRTGVVGCSSPIFININLGKPSSLHVVEVQIGALGCPS